MWITIKLQRTDPCRRHDSEGQDGWDKESDRERFRFEVGFPGLCPLMPEVEALDLAGMKHVEAIAQRARSHARSDGVSRLGIHPSTSHPGQYVERAKIGLGDSVCCLLGVARPNRRDKLTFEIVPRLSGKLSPDAATETADVDCMGSLAVHVPLLA